MTKKTENEKELKMVKKSTAKKPTVTKKQAITKKASVKKPITKKTVATKNESTAKKPIAKKVVATNKTSTKKQAITKKKNVVPKDFMNKPTKTSQNASKTSQKASESIKEVKKIPTKIVKENASKKPSIKKIVVKKVNANSPVKRDLNIILYNTDLAGSLFSSKAESMKFYKIVDTILNILHYDHDKSKTWRVYVETKMDNGIPKLHVRSICSKCLDKNEKAKIKYPNKYYKVKYFYKMIDEISFVDKITITEITKNDF